MLISDKIHHGIGHNTLGQVWRTPVLGGNSGTTTISDYQYTTNAYSLTDAINQ